MMRPLFKIAAFAGLLVAAPATAQVTDLPDVVGLADADGDGTVSEDEFTAYYALMWDLLTGGKAKVDLEQANPVLRAIIRGVLPAAKAVIGRDQMLDVVPSYYRIADTDHDGSITMAEMRAWKASAMTPPGS